MSDTPTTPDEPNVDPGVPSREDSPDPVPDPENPDVKVDVLNDPAPQQAEEATNDPDPGERPPARAAGTDNTAAFKAAAQTDAKLDKVASQVSELSKTIGQLAHIVVEQDKRLQSNEEALNSVAGLVQTPTPSAPARKGPKPLARQIVRFRSLYAEHVVWWRPERVTTVGNEQVIQRARNVQFAHAILDIDTDRDPDAQEKIEFIRNMPDFGKDIFEDRQAQPREPVVVVAGVKGTVPVPETDDSMLKDTAMHAELVV